MLGSRDTRRNMLQQVLPQVLLQLRRLPGGREDLNMMKFVSKSTSLAGREAEAQYDGAAVFFVREMANLVTSTQTASTRSLVNLAKEFEHERQIQKLLLFCFMDCIATKHGQRWVEIGSSRPQGARLYDSPGLVAALAAGQLSFTPAEWRTFHVIFLEPTHCVQVGTSYFQVDLSTVDPAHRMAPVEVLHDIVVDSMVLYGADKDLAVVHLFLLECLHQAPWKDHFPTDTYEVKAMRALKLVVSAMQQYSDDLELQTSACTVLFHACVNLGPGATHKLVLNGGHDAMEAVLAAMRRFPTQVQVQLLGAKLISLDSEVPACAVGLHPERIRYRDSLFVGLDVTLLDFCMQARAPVFTYYTCKALQALFTTRIHTVPHMQTNVAFFAWCFETWNKNDDTDNGLRDAAISAMLCYIQAKDRHSSIPSPCGASFSRQEAAKHRDDIRNTINGYSMHQGPAGTPAANTWLGGRILSHLCAYATVPGMYVNSDRVCRSLLFLTQLCQDSDGSRNLFVYQSDGISTCLELAADFVTRGSDDDMDVAVHALDLLQSIYVQANPYVPGAVHPGLMLTASAPYFASSNLLDVALRRRASTSMTTQGRRLLPVEGGATVIDVLQNILRVSASPAYILEACMVTLAALCVFPVNARCIDPRLITAVCERYADDPDEMVCVQKKAKIILSHC